MKPRTIPFRVHRLAIAIAIAAAWVSTGVQADVTDLANMPLDNATRIDMLPNIMFVLDDSGSMDWSFMPDYVTNSYCRGSNSLTSCGSGDAPYYSSAFNRVYYDPMIDYTPPKDADGNSKTNYTTWTAVPYDGYMVQSTSTIDLTNEYPERKACKTAGSDVNSANCKSQVVLGATTWSYSYPDGTYPIIKTKYSAPFYHTTTVEWCASRSNNYPRFGTNNCQNTRDATHPYVKYTNWTRVDIVPTRNSYPGPNGTTRTYAQEMTNFANWHAWYRTRMQMMKTSLTQAFWKVRGDKNDADPDDKNYFHARVGFSTTSERSATPGTTFQTIDTFNPAHKATWFNRMMATDPSHWTPLRGALSKAGKIYAGKLGSDPVQYSCQRNFTILSTDGYWNTNEEVAGSDTDSFGPDQIDNTDVGDQDSGATRPSKDDLAKANTLADVAYYYYHTDLRTEALTNCQGALRPDPDNPAVLVRGDVCNNDVPESDNNSPNMDDTAKHQHMTTFTIGLGVDGSLQYKPDYKTKPTGDFLSILQNSGKKWPSPIVSNESGGNNTYPEQQDNRIDDLWHAAVNGRGTYFSARDPESLGSGLQSALTTMGSTTSLGASAATGSLQPTADQTDSQLVYVASYRINWWDGDVAARTIDLDTGALSAAATWSAAGLLNTRVGATTDTRKIYVSVNGARKDFLYSNLNADQQAYFDNSKLSQYVGWTVADKAAAGNDGTHLVEYLRGQTAFQDDIANATKLYRNRQFALGDIIHSQPVYVKTSPYNYGNGHDPSYGGRGGVLYVAANDGMLHAFCTETIGSGASACAPGQELWAYVIPTVMKEMYYLADTKYATDHRYLVDGPLSVSDVFINGGWKTILVGGLGKGGRGYYAFDITAPADPKLLWTFSAEGADGKTNTLDDRPNIGFSYGIPLIAKVDANGNGVGDDSEWRVIVSSGHNNVPNLPYSGDFPSADGGGYLYVLDAATGTPVQTIATGSGSDTAPSGLTHLQAYVADMNIDNTAQAVYGGDLNGDMWRFNFGGGGMATKVISVGAGRPITTSAEITDVRNGPTVLYFGTGRYLGQSDLTTGASQVLVSVRADASNLSLGDLVAQDGTKTIDWSQDKGWYYALTGSGERVHLNPQIFLDTLMFATVMPTATLCQPGGTSRLYFLNYSSGKAAGGGSVPYVNFGEPLVGLSFVLLPGKNPMVIASTRDKATSEEFRWDSDSGGGGVSPDSGTRIIWRELMD